MKNVIDILLNSSDEMFKMPSEVVEIKRLSEAFGEEFKVMLRGLTYTRYSEIQEESIDFKTGDINLSKIQINTLLEGVYDLDGRLLFKNKELLDKFKVHSFADLVKKILSPGEITQLYSKIEKLGGFGDKNIEEEIKK